MTTTIILFAVFIVLLLLDVPIAICLGASATAAILSAGQSLSVVAMNTYSGISKTLLLAIPFFIVSGNIMVKAGISTRLVKFVNSLVGHRKGGIAIVSVITAVFFGAISGSGPATVAALGIVLIPAMIDAGFSPAFATALMATASSTAIVIPPSIAYVVYASITGDNVGKLFMAGILPGILIGLALIAVILIEVKRKNIQPSGEKHTAKEIWDSFKDAFWGLLMPVIILGGIYGGIFTPTEAAAVAAVYGLIVGVFIYKEIKLKELFQILIDSAKTTGSIMLIIASATLFSYVCTLFGISSAAEALLSSVATNKFIFLLVVNIILLIAGLFLDANSAMYIFIPIMYPVCQKLGINPIFFGVLTTVNLAIGQVTPPVGVNLFVAIGVKLKNGIKVTLQETSKAVAPMVVACLVVLLGYTYFPRKSNVKIVSSEKMNQTEIALYDAEKYDASKDAFKGTNDWSEMTWHFACSTGETSTWAKAGRYFGALMKEATGGKVKVVVDGFSDQLTNGNQKDGITSLIEGNPLQLSMHSNLIYSAFDDRFNVVSLPYIYDDYDDVDAKFDGEAGNYLKAILEEKGLHCFGIAENGFRQLTNSKRPVKSVDDLKGLKIRVAGSNLLMQSYAAWGANATNMNWGETYTALQQNTVEGQENPLPAIASASVQEVQKYLSEWNAYYDCLFFCMNGKAWDSLTDDQKTVVEVNAKRAVEYQRMINRYECDELIKEWEDSGKLTVTHADEVDMESFRNASSGVVDWYKNQLINKDGFDAEYVEGLVDSFAEKNKFSKTKIAAYDAEKYDASKEAVKNDSVGWQDATWHFACSTGETSTWAKAGRYFGALMKEASGGKIKVVVDGFSDQLTNGNQKDGITSLIEGNPLQLSMHSNLIYSAFDDRFNVVSLPYIYDDYDDVDAKFDGEAGNLLKKILEEKGLHCFGIAENGFRQLTNSKRPVKSVDDLKGLKIRVAGSNLLMQSYAAWGANATNMNWGETYTALQQNTVEGQENPLPAIASASVQEVQKYLSEWNAYYDCLFFCMNGSAWDSLTAAQKEIVEANAKKAVEYQRIINRYECDELIKEWEDSGKLKVVHADEVDMDSFKKASSGVAEWYKNQLKNKYDAAEVEKLVNAFTGRKMSKAKIALYDAEKYDAAKDAVKDDIQWKDATWHFACSTGKTSTWAKAGRYFGALMKEASGGKVKVVVDGFSDQLTNGNQKDGITSLIEGNPLQLSMHSNLIYSAFDDRFNVVSLPYIYDDYDDVDAKFDGEAGDYLKKILEEKGLHCFGIAENGFRQLTNSKRPVKSVDDLKGLKIRVAGSNLLMQSYAAWGANATNMNWGETYTALQQNTVEGQENPLPAIDSASVQDVQKYLSEWNAYYDCLFFCMNAKEWNSLTPAQQKVVEANAKKAVEYQRMINRYECDELIENWEKSGKLKVVHAEEVDMNSFKEATKNVIPWYKNQLKNKYDADEVEKLVNAFAK